jgi:hypothetical protein
MSKEEKAMTEAERLAPARAQAEQAIQTALYAVASSYEGPDAVAESKAAVDELLKPDNRWAMRALIKALDDREPELPLGEGG